MSSVVTEQMSQTNLTERTDLGLIGSTVAAASFGGEISLTQVIPSSAQSIMEILNPFKVLLGGIGQIFKGFAGAFKKKRKWIPAIFLAMTWVALVLLPFFGFNPEPVKVLSILTFAQGGMSDNVLGIIGGIIGKGVFAGFFISLFAGGNPFKGMGSGFVRMFSLFSCKGKGDITALMSGIGFALIAYNFMAGYISFYASMTAVVSFFFSLGALGKKSGFLYRFICSLTAKKQVKEKVSKKTINEPIINHGIAGLSVGFAIAIPLSFVHFNYMGYAAGAFILVVGIILGIATNGKKEVATL